MRILEQVANARSLTLLSLALAAASLCSAASITYDVNLTIGTATVTGDIFTDGTLGVITAQHEGVYGSPILDWNLVLTSSTCPERPCSVDLLGPISDPSISSDFFDESDDLSATATQLLFNFSGTDSPGWAYIQNGTDGVCFLDSVTGPCFFSSPPGGEELVGDGGNDYEYTSLSGTQVIGTAESSSVPEPSSLALLAAGVTVLALCKMRAAIRIFSR